MRNYAGHRLAPWLAHVMVSRQETARPLLTQGEVMQLPSTEELVMVAGLAPIRAAKLRYYEDSTFTARVLPPPALGATRYADAPPPRSNDWGCLARRPDARLARAEDDQSTAEDGGLQQERHPGIEPAPVKPEPKQLDLPDLERDDTDAAADKRTMDRVRTSLVRADAMNQGRDRDLLPGM
jgi:type IV secretion system protein VirD4